MQLCTMPILTMFLLGQEIIHPYLGWVDFVPGGNTSCDPHEERCHECGDVSQGSSCDHESPDYDCTPTAREHLRHMAEDGNIETCTA